MLASISNRQFLEWMAYAELEPFDEVRADLRAASVKQAIVRMLGGGSLTIDDCLLSFDKEDEAESQGDHAQTWQDQKFVASLWVAAFQAKKADREAAAHAHAARPRS